MLNLYSKPLPLPPLRGRREGLKALWTGTTPNIARNAIVNAAELATYDQIKHSLLKTGLFEVRGGGVGVGGGVAGLIIRGVGEGRGGYAWPHQALAAQDGAVPGGCLCVCVRLGRKLFQGDCGWGGVGVVMREDSS